MNWTLLIIALGGYNADSPGLASVDFQNSDACIRAGQSAVSAFETKYASAFSGETTIYGARRVKFICLHKTTGEAKP